MSSDVIETAAQSSRDATTTPAIGSTADELRGHYDLGNRFFALWLDRDMCYSCALFDQAQDLEAAQEAKLDWHLNSAGAGSAKRLLDIGCGWGGLMARAAARYPGLASTGLTISEAQAEFVRGRSIGGAEVIVVPWVDYDLAARFDAIVSVGAFEHFARKGASAEERLHGYRRFFASCYRWLPAGGGMSLQTIAYGNMNADDQHPLINEEIYPQSELPSLAEIAEAARGLFEIRTVRNDGDHYVETLRHWLRRLRARRSEALALVGGPKLKQWEDYLRASLVGFHRGNTALLRLSLRRTAEPRYAPAREALARLGPIA